MLERKNLGVTFTQQVSRAAALMLSKLVPCDANAALSDLNATSCTQLHRLTMRLYRLTMRLYRLTMRLYRLTMRLYRLTM